MRFSTLSARWKKLRVSIQRGDLACMHLCMSCRQGHNFLFVARHTLDRFHVGNLEGIQEEESAAPVRASSRCDRSSVHGAQGLTRRWRQPGQEQRREKCARAVRAARRRRGYTEERREARAVSALCAGHRSRDAKSFRVRSCIMPLLGMTSSTRAACRCGGAPATTILDSDLGLG